MPGGSYDISDFNRWDLANTPVNPSLLDTGDERINQVIRSRADAHSRQLQEVTSLLGFWTTESQLPFGGYSKTAGYEVDEVGRAKPTKGGVGYFCGLPLRRWMYDTQWTYDYMQQATQADLARDILGMEDADDTYVMSRILDAIFNPVNYTYVDQIDRSNVRMPIVPMRVKALANADGLELPPGPNGERFDPSTHTHYDYDTSVTASKVSAGVKTVREHNRDSVVQIWINSAEEVAFNALPIGNFKPLPYAGVLQATTRDVLTSPTLNSRNISDRMIGKYDDAEVWVKYQIPANYGLIVDINAPTKVVGIRYHDKFGGRNLVPVVEDRNFPFIAKGYRRVIGAGVWNRTAAAVINFNQNGGAYVAPTFPGILTN